MRSVLITALLGWVALSCSPPPYGYTLHQLYTRERFSGKELNGRTIGVLPIINENGPCTTGFLKQQNHFTMMRKIRPDLKLLSADSVEELFRKKWPADSLTAFYTLVFKGDMVSLQTADSLWSAANSGLDYAMVLRLKGASRVVTFNRQTRKRLRIEVELWDTREIEVVWRVVINGVSMSKALPDSQFIMEAIQKAYSALPKLLPSYDNSSW